MYRASQILAVVDTFAEILMPIYEYECEKCHKTTEALRRMADMDEPVACEHCGNKKTHRAHSKVALNTGGGRSQSLPMSSGGGSCGRCGGPHGSCGA